MSTVRVQEVLRRYHFKPSERDLQPRFNQLTEMFLRDQLEAVLAEAGIMPSELVCIKELRLALDYDENKSDFEINELWRKVLLKSVYQQIGSGNRDDLIRYPSEIEAIKSVARSLAFGLINHQWAWRQLGITDGQSADLHRAKEQWLSYLINHPQMLLPVFKGLMSENTFIKLLERKVLHPQDLIYLTDIASKILGVDINWRDIVQQRDKLQTVEAGRKATGLSRAQVPNSALILALLQSLQSSFEFHLDSAPNEAITSAQHASKIAITKLLFWAVIAPGHHKLNITHTTRQIESKLLELWHIVDIELTNYPQGEHLEIASADYIHLPEEQNFRQSHEGRRDKEFYSDDELICGNSINKQSLSSRYGGLLFLLNRLEQDCVLTHLEHPQIAHHSLSWRLENFCWLLLPECKGDVIVKVFSGGIFENPQDAGINEVLSHQNELLLADIADEFKQKIVASLNVYSRGAATHNSDLFAAMCRRNTRIEAQPGWVNVFYELDSVDTLVRSAGLDLNPDFLPWLAYVVKFYYE